MSKNFKNPELSGSISGYRFISTPKIPSPIPSNRSQSPDFARAELYFRNSSFLHSQTHRQFLVNFGLKKRVRSETEIEEVRRERDTSEVVGGEGEGGRSWSGDGGGSEVEVREGRRRREEDRTEARSHENEKKIGTLHTKIKRAMFKRVF